MLATACSLGSRAASGTIRFAEKGILQFVVDVRTRGAHGPYAHLSPSAIRIAGRIMEELDEIKTFEPVLPGPGGAPISAEARCRIATRRWGRERPNVIAQVSVNVGRIQGGSKVNMVASDCTMEVDVRVPLGDRPRRGR